MAKNVGLSQKILIGVIRMYQTTLSLVWGSQCRYHPSCSQFSIEAIEQKGVYRGVYETLKRLGRCHPWGGCGYDPVKK